MKLDPTIAGDFHKGVLYQLTNVAVWKEEVLVREIMQRELGVPVVLNNDANCMAYAERKLGAGRELRSLVCLTLGIALGGGIIVDHHLLRGRRISTRELGQTSIHYCGRVGSFGNRGLLRSISPV